MPSIKSLRVFVLTMEQGSLTLAAQTMNISQPAATRLLLQFEDEFGAPLFFRDRKTLTPSREAELLYPEASRILASYEELPAILQTLKHDDTMPMKVVGQSRCSLGLVAPAVAELTRAHPEIQIDLDIHKRTELRLRKIWDRFDVGVFASPLHVSFAEVRYARRVFCDVLVHKGHPLARKAQVTAADLADYHYITVRHALKGRTVVEEALLRTNEKLDAKHEVSNAFAAVSLVQFGIGYTITDRFTVDPMLLPNLAFVPFAPAPSVEYVVCVSQDTRTHPKTRQMIDILVSKMESVPEAP